MSIVKSAQEEILELLATFRLSYEERKSIFALYSESITYEKAQDLVVSAAASYSDYEEHNMYDKICALVRIANIEGFAHGLSAYAEMVEQGILEKIKAMNNQN